MAVLFLFSLFRVVGKGVEQGILVRRSAGRWKGPALLARLWAPPSGSVDGALEALSTVDELETFGLFARTGLRHRAALPCAGRFRAPPSSPLAKPRDNDVRCAPLLRQWCAETARHRVSASSTIIDPSWRLRHVQGSSLVR